MLSRDLILSSIDLAVEKIDVPAWGGSIFVRPFTGGERGLIEQESMDKDPAKVETFRARLVVRAICDEKGKRLFTDADIPALQEKAASAIDLVAKAVIKLNGMGADEVEAAGES